MLMYEVGMPEEYRLFEYWETYEMRLLPHFRRNLDLYIHMFDGSTESFARRQRDTNRAYNQL